MLKRFNTPLFGGGLPPLPLLTNSDAEAAYSLRKLTPSYSGSAVRIRRSSDDEEQDIGFSGLDFDVASAESFCGVGNGFVVTWYDQSGNSNDATQATAANQPQIVSSGSVILENGKPAIQGNGSSTELVVGTGLYALDQAVVNHFSVQKVDDDAATDYVLSGSLDGGYLHLYNTGEQFRIGTGRTAGVRAGSGSGITDVQHLTYMKADRSTIVGYLNGESDIDISDNDANFNRNNLHIMSNDGANYLNGTIQEVIIYTTDKLSARTVIEGDINRYYNIF